nr:isoform 2 of annexin a7 [Quercus suber]
MERVRDILEGHCTSQWSDPNQQRSANTDDRHETTVVAIAKSDHFHFKMVFQGSLLLIRWTQPCRVELRPPDDQDFLRSIPVDSSIASISVHKIHPVPSFSKSSRILEKTMSYYNQGPPGPPPPGSHSPYPPQHHGGGYPPPQQPYGQPGYQQGPPPPMNQGYGPPPGQAPYPAHGQAPYGAPPPGQFHQPPPGQFHQPPPGQYGHPPPGQHPGYGAPAPPAPPSPGYIPGQQSHMDMSRAADDLRAAMKGFGTDEKTLVRVLGSLGPLEINSVKAAFQARHRRDLMKDVHSETSGYFREGLEAILRGPMDQDCHALYESIKGIGTKESAMNDVLLGRSNADLNAIRNHYQHKYRRTLESDVKGDLSMKTERLFDMVMTARRAEESSPVVPQQIDQDVQEIYRATEGKSGTDQLTVCSIISSRSNGQLRAISHAYKQKYHRSLEENVKKEFSGHMEDALLFMIRSAEDPAKHDADLLEDAMKGLGTKDAALVRRIVMIHWNPDRLHQAKAAYKHFYKQDLATRIKSETSGDYEKLMLACIGVQNPYVRVGWLKRLSRAHDGQEVDLCYRGRVLFPVEMTAPSVYIAKIPMYSMKSHTPYPRDDLSVDLDDARNKRCTSPFAHLIAVPKHPFLVWHRILDACLLDHRLGSMLHRSNSIAGMPERLRRGTSTASGNTSSSATHTTPKSSDPFVSRQAEVAAAEAYLRSCRTDGAHQTAQRLASSKLQRRKSQAGGRTEGSHFADARMGLRRSTSTKDDKISAKTGLQRWYEGVEVVNSGAERLGVTTRTRAVIHPNVNPKSAQHDHLPLPSSGRPRRKSQTGHTDGSPVARNPSVSGARSSALHLETPVRRGSTKDNTMTCPQLSTAVMTPGATNPSIAFSVDNSKKEIQDTVDARRDRVLQDFQQRKVRERRSFIIAPFQKRRATNDIKGSQNKHDSFLPPFNYAADPTMAPPPCESVRTAIEPVAGINHKSRTFSSTIKGRVTKMFRKTSKVRTELPPQHIEASFYHYPDVDAAGNAVNREIMPDRNMFMESTCDNGLTMSPLTAVPGIERGRFSAVPPSTAKSRVTSWTNSTTGDTWSTRGGNGVSTLDEQGVWQHDRPQSGLKRSDSMATLRKASSFLGRSARNRLQRTSKSKLQTSQETHGLYDALREHIHPRKSSTTPGPETPMAGELWQQRKTSSGAQDPSSERVPSSTSSKADRSTIRAVTHDTTAYRPSLPETIRELASPASTPPSNSHNVGRHVTTKAPQLSDKQIGSRLEKTESLWQTRLDDTSPTERHSKYEDNPYELPSLVTHNQNHEAHNPSYKAIMTSSRRGFPVFAPVMLSPSVYSRATDGTSPRAESPLDTVGTVITVTGREVRRYSISPPKPAQSNQENRNPSKEWKRWLSDEFRGFGEKTYEQYSLASTFPQSSKTNSKVSPLTSNCDLAHGNSSSPPTDSALPTTFSKAVTGRERPKLEGRTRSSFMNDRYPMIDGSRNSSGQSVGSGTRKASSALSNRRPESKLTTLTHDTDVSGLDQGAPKARVVNARHSMAVLESPHRSDNGYDAINTGREPSLPVASNSRATPDAIEVPSSQYLEEPTARARSAFDLRAKYRHNSQASARPLEVRRSTAFFSKPSHLDLVAPLHLEEDPTLQSIAAGPYAPSRREKENVTPDSAAGLPTLSSSEWLSRTNKATRRVNLVHPALREREPARGGSSSAAQKMATDFLEAKAGREAKGFL